MKTGLSTMLVIVMLLLAGLQAGCAEVTAADKAFVQDLAMDWLESKGMRYENADGTPNARGAANLLMAALIGSGDDEVDAVLGIYGAVKGVVNADKAMDEARASGDAAAMDEVIKSRPHDWSYRSSRAVLALAQGDMATYEQQANSFAEIAREQGVPPARQARQIIKDYETISVPDTGEPCNRKYLSLAGAYNTLYKETGEQRWNELAAQAYATMLHLCP
jgi:hypothetical protein